MIRKLFISILVILLLADIAYSFFQHYYTPFDGDMAGGIVPASDVKTILDSPLGYKIFKENITYPNPNRFFCHWSFYKYFNCVPLFLQNYTNPIDSAYLSCAIAKTTIQLVLILLLAFLIAGKIKLSLDFFLSAVLITPLFQTNGYRSYMGIIDPSTTYTFFYALPIAILIIYFAPLFYKRIYNLEIKGYRYIRFLWIPLALVSSLSGPLNPGIALVVCMLVYMHYFRLKIKNSRSSNLINKLRVAFKEIPNDYYIFLLPITIFSLYSLFLGRYNSVDLVNKIPLSTLYLRIPEGIYYSFTQKLGFPILFIVLLTNSIIIKKKFYNEEGKKILILFKWIGAFSLVYMLLLPLGGYRTYRPFVLRYDTIIPITLCLMFIFGKTTLFLLKNLSTRQKIWYAPFILFVLFVFTNSDTAQFDKNKCEKNALKQISKSSESVVRIDSECTVLSWKIIENPQESELNAMLLKRWKIINTDKLYYQKPSVNPNSQ